MVSTKQLEWARLWATAKPPDGGRLRHGAWYRVVDTLPRGVVLDTQGEYVLVPRALVERRPQRPHRFTLVARPKDAENPARGTPEDLGHRYAVCPHCGTRLRLMGEPKRTQCLECGHAGEVAWWETG